jgi:DNA polymerase-3 subunit delta
MIKNLLLLTGECDFRLRERARLYQEKFLEKYPSGEIDHLGEDTEINELENAALTPNLFGGKRMVVCDQFWTPDKFEKAQKKNFFDALSQVEGMVTVMCIEPKLDKRKKSTKFLLKSARTETFAAMEENQVLAWTEKYAHKYNGNISRSNAQALTRRCGLNLWNLSSEIKKLISAHETGEITAENIKSMTLPRPEIEIWDFLKHLSEKNTVAALKSFQTLMVMGQSPHQIFPMLQREVRIHALIRSGIDQHLDSKSIAAAAGLHPFVVNKTKKLTQNFSLVQITQLYETLFQLDRRLKTGGIFTMVGDTSEFELAIEKFVIEVCKP